MFWLNWLKEFKMKTLVRQVFTGALGCLYVALATFDQADFVGVASETKTDADRTALLVSAEQPSAVDRDMPGQGTPESSPPTAAAQSSIGAAADKSGRRVASSGGVIINEIRIDQPGTDVDEYFELAGAAGTSLDGLTYVVIGDGAGGSGVIEAVVDLTGNSIGASGFFVAAEPTFTLGVPDLVTNLNFENSDNVTHLLVTGFSGAPGDDLDDDDDCVLDSTPWTSVVDSIALIEEENPPGGTECHYGPPTVGPDGPFVPGHVYRCHPAGLWTIGSFSTNGLCEKGGNSRTSRCGCY